MIVFMSTRPRDLRSCGNQSIRFRKPSKLKLPQHPAHPESGSLGLELRFSCQLSLCVGFKYTRRPWQAVCCVGGDTSAGRDPKIHEMLMAHSPRSGSNLSPVPPPRKTPRGHVALTSHGIASMSPRVGPGVPRRPRRPGQVLTARCAALRLFRLTRVCVHMQVLNVNAQAANDPNADIRQPLWTMPHARNRDAMNKLLHSPASGSGSSAAITPTRPANLGPRVSHASPNTTHRKFFFATPSPKQEGEATSSGRVKRRSVEELSLSDARRSEETQQEVVPRHATRSARSTHTSGKHMGDSKESPRSQPESKASGVSRASSEFSDSTDAKSPRSRTRRRRRKGVASSRPPPASLRLDLSSLRSQQRHVGPSRSPRWQGPKSAIGTGVGRRFSPRHRAAPSLGDYSRGGVLGSRPTGDRSPRMRRAGAFGGGGGGDGDGGGGEREQSERKLHNPAAGTNSFRTTGGHPTRPASSQSTSRSRRATRRAVAGDSAIQTGVASAAVQAGRASTRRVVQSGVRPIRVLANHAPSPRGVLERLAAKNSGTTPTAQEGSGTGLDGRPRSSSGRSRGRPPLAATLPAGGAGAGTSDAGGGPAGAMNATIGVGHSGRLKRVNLAPLKLDFGNTTVRPSPLSAQPLRRKRGLGVGVGVGAGAALPPMARGLTRTIRSPTDDHRPGGLGPAATRGMVVLTDEQTAGSVLLSGRRGSAAKLTPLSRTYLGEAR